MTDCLLLLTMALLPHCPQTTDVSSPVYVVEKGDTLWALSERYHSTVRDLAWHNHIADPDLIQVGQQLVVEGLWKAPDEYVLPPGSIWEGIQRTREAAQQAEEARTVRSAATVTATPPAPVQTRVPTPVPTQAPPPVTTAVAPRVTAPTQTAPAPRSSSANHDDWLAASNWPASLWPTVRRIVVCESGWNVNAWSPSGRHYGLMQADVYYWGNPGSDPVAQLNLGYHIYQVQGWGAWECY